MVAAMALGFDNQGSSLGSDLAAQTCAGDASVNDYDVKFTHLSSWLRIGKPRRLGVAVMFNGGFTDLLLVALAAILVAAAVIDVRTFTISNRLNGTVAAGAPLYWLSIALNPWPGMAIQLAAGAIVFLLLAVAFFAGMMCG